MRRQVNELEGASLDWAVSECQGFAVIESFGALWNQEYSPSTNWTQGGPIIERYCINLFRLDPKTEDDNRFWVAHNDGIYCRYGLSALQAAMRCYVASKLGETVEIPEAIA